MADYVLSAKITGDNKEFKKAVDDTKESVGGLDESTNEFSNGLKTIAKVAAAAFAIDKIVSFGGKIVETTASLNAMDAQFEQIFKGKEGEEALTRMNNISKELDIHGNRLTGTFNRFGGQVKGAGMDGTKALEATDKATRLAADAAAYFDVSLEDSSASLASFMKGNFQAGDAIGVFTSAKQMDIRANEMYGKSWADLAEDERQWLLLDTVEKTYELNGAMGQAVRESGEYENVMGNLKATWGEFLSVIGQPILQKTIDGMQAAIGVISGMTSMVTENKTALMFLGIALGTVALAILGYNIALNASVIAAKLATAASSTFGAIMGFITSPITLVILAIGALIAIFVHLYNTNEEFRTKVQEVWGAVKQFISTAVAKIKEVIQTVIGNVISWWNENQETIKKTTTNVWNAIKSVVSTVISAISAVITTVVGAMVSFWNNNSEQIKSIAQSVWNIIKNTISTVINVIAGIIRTIMALIRGDWAGAWEAIKGVVTTIISGIKTHIENIMNIIKNIIQIAWNTIKATTSTLLNAIKTTVSNIFNSFKSVVSTAFNAVKTAVSSGMTKAWNTVTGFLGKFKTAGANIVGSIADGIKGAIGKVTGAISSVTSKIRAFLPFSPAKIGPLADIHKLNFGGTISMGIDKGAYEVEKAMQSMLTMNTPFNVETSTNKGIEREHSTSTQAQSNTFILKLGNRSFKAFVEDISNVQNQEIELEEIYGL